MSATRATSDNSLTVRCKQELERSKETSDKTAAKERRTKETRTKAAEKEHRSKEGLTKAAERSTKTTARAEKERSTEELAKKARKKEKKERKEVKQKKQARRRTVVLKPNGTELVSQGPTEQESCMLKWTDKSRFEKQEWIKCSKEDLKSRCRGETSVTHVTWYYRVSACTS